MNVRITSENGRLKKLTDDLRRDRVNIDLVDGVVMDASVG